MKKFANNREQGFIKYIVIVVVALVIIAYFRADIQKLIMTPGVKNALVTALGWISEALNWLLSKLAWLTGLLK